MLGVFTTALCVSLAFSTRAEMVGEAAIEKLREAVDRYPEDPDLAWALTRELAGSEHTDQALEHAEDFLDRWPERRPDARVQIARWMLDVGDAEKAAMLLDEELKLKPKSAVARFYRGMAFRAKGRIVESNREFAISARLAPELRAESLLAQALGLFDLGKDDEAVDLLREILKVDPTSESAIRARLMLRQREVLSMQRIWRLDAYAGFEWDSNVLLESAANEAIGTDREDFRGIWGLGATIRALTTESASLALGYRFDQSMHDELGTFDLITNSGFASGSLELTRSLIARLDALAWNTRQSGHNELTAGSIRPNLILSLGPDWGAIRFFAQYEILEYDDQTLISPWERDGYSVGGGLEHFLPLPIRSSFLSTSASFQRNSTQADTSGLDDGFDGDFDYDSWKVRARATLMLPGRIRSGLEVAYSRDDYLNDNFLNALGTFEIKKREDDIVSSRIEFSRTLVKHTELQVYWRGTWRMSNVSFYDYDQQVVGALIRVTTD
jgi:tetratricopeptide (TPR) repeat protein